MRGSVPHAKTRRYCCPKCGVALEEYKLPEWLEKIECPLYLKLVLLKLLEARVPMHWKNIAGRRKYASEHISRLRTVIADNHLPYTIPLGRGSVYTIHRIAEDSPTERQEVVPSRPRLHDLRRGS